MVRLFGYWHSEREPHWPDPAWFVEAGWDPFERELIALYLRSAYVPWAAGGLSWCRFRCAERWIGSAEHTDGTFLWPQGLVHYVERHEVRPPDEFIQHVLDRRVPQKVELALGTAIDTTWWEAQRGFRQGESFRSPSPVGAFVANLDGVSPTVDVLGVLREFPAVQELSLAELRDRILGGSTLVLLSSAYEMPRPAALAKLDAVRIPVHFEPEPG